jgi:ATPase family associated with various cellular activities (AAA)
MDDKITLSVPKQDNIVVHVQKSKKKIEKDSLTFRSYAISVLQGNIYIYQKDIKSVNVKFLYIILRKHGMTENTPIHVMLGTPVAGTSIDWNPMGYQGQTVWYFEWDGVKCSVTGKGDDHSGQVWIRVHDLTPGVGKKVIDELSAELLTYYKDPNVAPPSMLTLYTVKQSPHGHQWVKHSTRLHRDMKTIYIDTKIKDQLVAQLTKFKESSAMYDKYGVTWKRVHLFHGPPGTGKTSTILALASLFDKNIAKLTITPDLNSQDIETLFQTIPQGTFVILEDVDALFVEREAKGSVDFSTLLNCMDGITTQRGLVLFMTTNHPTKLDEAFLRPGRVDMSIEFALPNKEQRLEALKSLADDFADEHDAFLIKYPEISIAGIQKHLFDCVMEEKKTIL